MPAYASIVTTLGTAKLATALAEGRAVALTHFAVGDGGGNPYTPSAGQTGLVREVYRTNVTSLEVDPDNPNVLIAECVIPDRAGGWTAREIALIDGDGDLLVIGNLPETVKPVLDEGAGGELLFRILVAVTNATTVTLNIDPAIAIASRRYVDREIVQAITDHDADPAAHAALQIPHATIEITGVTRYATQAEAAAGVIDNAALTPAAAGARAGLNLRAFRVSGVFTVPARVTHVRVKLWGAGGGSTGLDGGTGGSGAYCEKIVAVAPGERIAVTVGTGGAGVITWTARAGNGGASSFGAHCTAGGGVGAHGGGGAGGVASSGDLNVNGSNGSDLGGVGVPGVGPFGGGDGGPTWEVGLITRTGGVGGVGASGGGSNLRGHRGGAGGPGLVIVEWQK